MQRINRIKASDLWRKDSISLGLFLYTDLFSAYKETVKKCGIPAIINSDQGSQFTSDDYKALLHSLNIRQSMDGRSRWADNIMIERWFRSLKTEQLYPNEYHSPRELRQLINTYVDDYNNIRPGSV